MVVISLYCRTQTAFCQRSTGGLTVPGSSSASRWVFDGCRDGGTRSASPSYECEQFLVSTSFPVPRHSVELHAASPLHRKLDRLVVMLFIGR